MAIRKTPEEILPLIAGLVPEERVRLIRLVLDLPNEDASAYVKMPVRGDEFSSNNDDALAWDAEGWDSNV